MAARKPAPAKQKTAQHKVLALAGIAVLIGTRIPHPIVWIIEVVVLALAASYIYKN